MSVDPNILKLADQLGKAIAESGRTQEFKDKSKAVRDDPDAQAAMQTYQELMLKLARKEQGNQPIEVEEKRALAEAQEKVYSNDKLKDLMQAQADYMELMEAVNNRIGQHLVTPDELAQPGGDGESQAN